MKKNIYSYPPFIYGMFNRISPEEECKIIEKTAQVIMYSDMEVAAIIFFESFKPLSILGGQFARLFVEPFLSFFGDMGITGHKLIETYEKRENIERLLKRIKELQEERKKIDKSSFRNNAHSVVYIDFDWLPYACFSV